MSVLNQMGDFFKNNPHMLLSEAIHHIGLSAFAVVVAMVISIPIGAFVGHLHKFSFIVVNGGNALRALPTLAIIAIAISIYGFGLVNITVALVILALPLLLTNTYVAVDTVDADMVRAARGMGLNGWQVLWRVELPNSIPLIMTAVRTSWVYVVATAYLANFAAYNGTLGDVIAGQGAYKLGEVLAAAVVSMAIALIGDFLLGIVQRYATPRGLKLAPVAAASAAAA